MLKFTKIVLKACGLIAFSSPCMDVMEYFYTGIERHVLRFFCYLTFDILTTGHEMAIISVTLVCKTISEISFVSLCYIPYFEGLLSN